MSVYDIIFTADGYVSRSLALFGVETISVGAFYIFLLSFLFLSFFFLNLGDASLPGLYFFAPE